MSLARPERKQSTATEDFVVRISYLSLGEGKTWAEVKQVARNRIRWRRFVDALCP